MAYMLKTDWDTYYKKPASATSFTRNISEQKIIGILKTLFVHKKITICELGGGGSFLADSICAALPVRKYHIIDMNDYGLNLLNQKTSLKDILTWERGDVTNLKTKNKDFDLVYSVGLIEHFDHINTFKAIESHFNLCKSGGYVFITFPTPTLLYRFIRSVAEILAIWRFPDERPLLFSEIAPQMSKEGRIIHQSVNYWIGLTQGYLLTKKF